MAIKDFGKGLKSYLNDAYLIYEGSPMNGSTITKSMDAFTKYDQKDYGTAYGVGIKKAFSHALTMKKEGYVPAIVVITIVINYPLKFYLPIA